MVKKLITYTMTSEGSIPENIPNNPLNGSASTASGLPSPKDYKVLGITNGGTVPEQIDIFNTQEELTNYITVIGAGYYFNELDQKIPYTVQNRSDFYWGEYQKALNG